MPLSGACGAQEEHGGISASGVDDNNGGEATGHGTAESRDAMWQEPLFAERG